MSTISGRFGGLKCETCTDLHQMLSDGNSASLHDPSDQMS